MELPVLNDQPKSGGESGCSIGSCGSTDDQVDYLSDAIREKVQNHPCYSEGAHHYFARMQWLLPPLVIFSVIVVSANMIVLMNLLLAWCLSY